MRHPYSTNIKILEGINCEFNNNILKCKKENIETSRKILVRGSEIELSDGNIRLTCEKANKKTIAMIKSASSHIQNMLNGLEEKFVYKLEICHVHFPMTVKVEGNKVVISNFLGEKESRTADILSDVNVEVKGNEITISSRDIEKAGQTSANIEKATRVPKKDKRVFQDGIFLTEKPRGKI
ncbi:MAG: 50S ribosomal protein L6 [Nanoarchaeota archaeon]|nr:50S ribosomal protein L6 [Nanoarchaeota archaeon]